MKKTWEVIKKVLVWIVVLIAVAMMIFTITSTLVFDRTDRGLFGFKFFVVLSDSMSKTDFGAGDIVISKSVDPRSLKVGDIITYISQDPNSFGETITHKIRSTTTAQDGSPAFITDGTTTDTDDSTPVTYPYIIGKYVGSVPKVGAFFQFLKTTPGYIVCIFVPFLILIVMQGVKVIRLFRVYKSQQMDQLKAEREQIEKERQASVDLLKQLQELQSQIAAQNAANSQNAAGGGENAPKDNNPQE